MMRCMAQSPRHLIGPYALSTSSDLKPLRSSNDYFPDIPSSHAYHVYTNVLVSQFMSGFAIADFDMFQTHPFLESSSIVAQQGPFHASLRALGNGPVTVTDVPGHCESSVFTRLAGRGRDGKTIALNGETPICVLDERCFDEVAQRGDGRGLRGYSKSKWGVAMGIWNVRVGGGWVKDSISPEDVASVCRSKDIVYWSYSQQNVYLMRTDPMKEIVLKELEFDVFTLVEMTDDIVCLGLIDKYNTLAAIHSREKNVWTFKCLGTALWVIAGHRRPLIKVEGKPISSVSWTIENVTVARASLMDYKEVDSTDKKFWDVKCDIF